jgi:hypothetical protein
LRGRDVQALAAAQAARVIGAEPLTAALMAELLWPIAWFDHRTGLCGASSGDYRWIAAGRSSSPRACRVSFRESESSQVRRRFSTRSASVVCPNAVSLIHRICDVSSGFSRRVISMRRPGLWGERFREAPESGVDRIPSRTTSLASPVRVCRWFVTNTEFRAPLKRMKRPRSRSLPRADGRFALSDCAV